MGEDIKEKIQNLRKELTELITDKIKPIRKELDELLKIEAQRICPFKKGDIITLENGNKGEITHIDYHSLDYEFYINEENKSFYLDFINKVDVTEYIYAYKVDNKKFSITWKISGKKMINNGSETGKRNFKDITPADFLIDEQNKKITPKPLPAIMQLGYMSFFESL